MDLTWYSTLVRPELTPPSSIFGPVWTLLYAMMFVALVLVLRAKPSPNRTFAIVCFGAQLVFNLIWSPLFFTYHLIGWALVDIVVLWGAIMTTMYAFARVSKWAMWLLVPYIAWMSFATYLNYSIWILN